MSIIQGFFFSFFCALLTTRNPSIFVELCGADMTQQVQKVCRTCFSSQRSKLHDPYAKFRFYSKGSSETGTGRLFTVFACSSFVRLRFGRAIFKPCLCMCRRPGRKPGSKIKQIKFVLLNKYCQDFQKMMKNFCSVKHCYYL